MSARLSATSSASIPIRAPSHRHSHSHSHSHSYGSALSTSQRATRRKSISSSSVVHAALLDAVKDQDSVPPLPLAIPNSHIPNSINKANLSTLNGTDNSNVPKPPPTPPSSLPNSSNGALQSPGGISFARKTGIVPPASNGSAISEGVGKPPVGRPRTRRASEGAHQSGGKGEPGDLKCDKCGKGYKHSSCLTKHLWEHTPEWQFTSKLLISKHQQVQLLEAASILVNMNPADEAQAEANGQPTPPASDSSNNADSPASSDNNTTPPPAFGSSPLLGPVNSSKIQKPSQRKRGVSHSFSRPMPPPSNSIPPPSPGFVPGSAPLHTSSPWSNSLLSPQLNGLSHAANERASPYISAQNINTPRIPPHNLDDEGLVAAVEMLSCSFQGQTPTASSFIDELRRHAGVTSPPLAPNGTRAQDIDMQDKAEHSSDDDYQRKHRSEDDEDHGVFGRMEE